MSANLAKFNPPNGSQILLYVDDILLASPTEQDCKIDTLALLHFLAEQGHKVSKNKLQLWKTTVKYLGYDLSQEGRHLDKYRKTAILQTLKLRAKRQMMSFMSGNAEFLQELENKETSSLDVFPLKLFDSPRIPRLRELLTSTPHPPLDPSTLLL